ncbi:MAG: hypothetical protein [Bacteriophage sp.]|nr:MAG: hypothetical protein [Bacteriophage sp.]
MENINIKVILDEVFGQQCNVCEDNSVISLADDGGIELRNYDIVIIRFNF